MQLLLLLGLLLGNLPTTAVSLTGRVITAPAGDPLEYATVSAYGPDSLLVDGTITNADGSFQLALERGRYRLRIEFLGFETRRIDVDLKDKTDLGELRLAATGLALDAVEVRAERSEMNLLLDKKVFNVGEDAISRGGSANQVLEQLPSVTVDAMGQVSLRGNAGVRILINGRPSTLANNNALESIPAESIERVEIITNPSARYEAAGTAGIINIILKKEQRQGYGGTASLTAGYPNDYRANLNLNYRGEKFSAFANGGARYSDYQGFGNLTRTTNTDGVLLNQRRTILQDRNDRAFNIYAGFDYQLSANQTLTAAYSLYDVVNDDLADYAFRFTDGDGEPTSTWKQELDYFEPGTYHQIDLTYTKTYAEEGRELSLRAQHDRWREPENEAVRIDEEFPTIGELLRYRTFSDESSADYLLQGDYSLPLGEGSKLEVGLRGETRVISSDYLAERFTGGSFAALPGFDNQLDYQEQIGAAYLQYQREQGDFSYQMGIRYEYTGIEVDNVAVEQPDFRKDYQRIFPSASATYKLSESTSTQLSYGRRIRRPRFWQLNTFGGIEDPTRLRGGNPDLDPAYTDRLELNLLQRWEKLTLNPAIYGSVTTDFFGSTIEQVSDNVFGLETGSLRVFPVNLDREYRYGIELTGNYRPGDALTLSGEVNYFGYQQRGEAIGRNFDLEFSTWSASLRGQLRLPHSIEFQGNLSQQGRYLETVQGGGRGWTWVDFALSKGWDNGFTLTCSARGPRFMETFIDLPSVQEEEYFRWTRWRGSVNVRYRFERGAGADARRGRGSIR